MTAPLDDSEAVRLCAEAMGYSPIQLSKTGLRYTKIGHATKGFRGHIYDPLTDHAQALALVKMLRIKVTPLKDVLWEVCPQPPYADLCHVVDADLNRAIVFCVAALQRAKAT